MNIKKPLLFTLGIGTLAFQYLYNETKKLKVTNYTVESYRLPKAFNNFRIVQLCDLHHSYFGNKQAQLIELIKAQKPDIIVITGDFIEPLSKNQNAIDLIDGINDYPIYYVLGNHESRIANRDKWIKLFKDKKVNCLRNQGIKLNKDNEEIIIYGIDDPLCTVRYLIDDKEVEYMNNQLTKLKEFNQDNLYTILLSHRPEFFDIYHQYDLDLILCGHAHGGQVCLPKIGAIYAPNQGLMPKYYEGIHQYKKTVEIISRGLGCSHLPIRFLCDPEIVVIDLKNNH